MLNGRVEREAIEKEGFESMMQDAADSPRTWMVRNGGKKSLQNGKVVVIMAGRKVVTPRRCGGHIRRTCTSSNTPSSELLYL